MEKPASDIKYGEAPAWFEPAGLFTCNPEEGIMSEVRELIDTELDTVCGGHHGHHGHHGGITGLFDFFGKLGNIVIQQNIAVQIAVAVGANASAFNLLGGQLNSSSIAA